MEVLTPASYLSKASWLIDESKRTEWTHAENKMFENALALFDKDTPDRWHRVANLIPGKTVNDVIRQYQELEDDVSKIEAGLFPVREYTTSPFTLDWVNHHCNNGLDGYNKFLSYSPGGKRGPGSRPSDQERKKGIPWTEEEHKLFLMGLRKYGKGDWRNISRNFVVTRTPTQVASHAQKYFIRQLSGRKDKRRASIHDITTVTLDTHACAPPTSESKRSSDSMANATSFQWPQQGGNAQAMTFNVMEGGENVLLSPYAVSPYGMKLQGHNGYIQNMGL